jgi:hypothetical protein
MLRLTPSEAPWLLAKLIGLLAYIGLGVLALRPGRPLLSCERLGGRVGRGRVDRVGGDHQEPLGLLGSGW